CGPHVSRLHELEVVSPLSWCGSPPGKTPASRISAPTPRWDRWLIPKRRSCVQMSPLKQSNNLAARMGRWSASHWKTAVFGWLIFVVAALVIGNMVGTKNIDQQDANVGQSHQADQLLKDAGFKQSSPLTEIVLIQSKTV